MSIFLVQNKRKLALVLGGIVAVAPFLYVEIPVLLLQILVDGLATAEAVPSSDAAAFTALQ